MTTPRAGAFARRDVPTCLPDEPVTTARGRLTSGPWGHCVVVNTERVVLGLLDQHALERADDVTAEAVMTVGPGTVRAHEDRHSSAACTIGGWAQCW